MQKENEKIQVTVVRNYSKTDHQKDIKSGLYVERDLPHYDLKKIEGAADVRIQTGDNVKAYLVGSSISHDELVALAQLNTTYKLIVIDAQRV